MIGACEARPATGGRQTWASKACAIKGGSGSQTLYLTFSGGAGNLFSIEWFKLYPAPSLSTSGWRQSSTARAGIYKSCLWSGADLWNFVRNYLAPEFASYRITAEIWMGTYNISDFADFMRPWMSDAGSLSIVRGTGFQWSGYQAMKQVLSFDTAMHLRAMQTENICHGGENSWQDALDTYCNYLYTYFESGKLIRQGVPKGRRSGTFVPMWDGNDGSGAKAAPGVYCAVAQEEKYSIRLTLTKDHRLLTGSVQ
jgi:hypothetical protein